MADQHERRARCAASSRSSHSMVGRSRWLVGSSSSRMSGSGASTRASAARRASPPERCAGILVAGQAELFQQIARRGADRRSGRARPRHRPASSRSRRNPAPAAGSGSARPAARSACRGPARSARPRSSAASICPSRCGRPGRRRSPAETESSTPSSSGVPPKVSAMSVSWRSGGGMGDKCHCERSEAISGSSGRRRSELDGIASSRWRASRNDDPKGRSK